MEIWDGYNKDLTLANIDLVRGEEISSGVYHLVSEVLVRHVDGDFLIMRRALDKPIHPGKFEATAGGSAMKGETALECVKRELLEETGVNCDEFTEVGTHVCDINNTIYCCFVCETDIDKNKIKLQDGETIDSMWVSKEGFKEFLKTSMGIESKQARFSEYYKKIDVM